MCELPEDQNTLLRIQQFPGNDTKGTSTRVKLDKQNFMKIKNFLHQDHMNRVKRQPTEWKNIFENESLVED